MRGSARRQTEKIGTYSRTVADLGMHTLHHTTPSLSAERTARELGLQVNRECGASFECSNFNIISILKWLASSGRSGSSKMVLQGHFKFPTPSARAAKSFSLQVIFGEGFA